MKKSDLIAILEQKLGVDPENLSPFAPRVEVVMGPQGKAPEIASKLALCERGAMLFQPRGTSRFAQTISCKRVKLFMLLRKITDYFYNKRKGMPCIQPYFSDSWVAFFGCDDELVDDIACELGSRGLSLLIVDQYRIIEPILDRHTTAMRGGRLPKRKKSL